MEEDDKVQKQEFLKQSIIGNGFSKENFMDFISQKKSDGGVNSIRCW